VGGGVLTQWVGGRACAVDRETVSKGLTAAPSDA